MKPIFGPCLGGIGIPNPKIVGPQFLMGCTKSRALLEYRVHLLNIAIFIGSVLTASVIRSSCSGRRCSPSSIACADAEIAVFFIVWS